MRRLVGPAAYIRAATLVQAQNPPAVRIDKANLSRITEPLLKLNGEDTLATLRLGGATGDAWFQLGADQLRPTASAIKTFDLVEVRNIPFMFTRHDICQETL